MKKKAASSWYIATTHYLTAGFVPGLICGAIGAFLVHTFTIDSPFLSQTIFACLVPIAAYIGVRYSAHYVHRAYVVTAAARIATISSFYYAAIQVAGVIGLIYFAVSSSFPEGIVLVMVIAFTQALSGFLVFYATSVTCIKDDPVDVSFTDPRVPSALFPSHYKVPQGAGIEGNSNTASPAATPARKEDDLKDFIKVVGPLTPTKSGSSPTPSVPPVPAAAPPAPPGN